MTRASDRVRYEKLGQIFIVWHGSTPSPAMRGGGKVFMLPYAFDDQIGGVLTAGVTWSGTVESDVRRYARRVGIDVLRLRGCELDDFVQDVVVKSIRAVQKKVYHPSTFNRIAHNMVRDYLRHKSRRVTASPWVDIGEAPCADSYDLGQPSSGPGFEALDKAATMMARGDSFEDMAVVFGVAPQYLKIFLEQEIVRRNALAEGLVSPYRKVVIKRLRTVILSESQARARGLLSLSPGHTVASASAPRPRRPVQ